VLIGSLRLLSDERLAHLAGDGSDPAFAALYRRYQSPLQGYSMSIVRDADDARDVLQNAWLKALVALRRNGRTSPIRPWLFRIVHNEAVTVLRRRAPTEPLLDVAAATAGPDEQVAVRQLPTGQRAALVMRELADLEYGEIAVALSTTEGNARQLVHAARSGLLESQAGRVLGCDSIREHLMNGDGRRLRGRRVSAHLSGCEACRSFAAEARQRRRAAAALVPGLGAPASSPGLLQGILAALGGSGGASAAVFKGAVAVGLVGASIGTAELTSTGVGGESHKPGTAASDVKTSGGGVSGVRLAVESAGSGTAAVTLARVAGPGGARPAGKARGAGPVVAQVTKTSSATDGPSSRDGDGRPRHDGPGDGRDGDGRGGDGHRNAGGSAPDGGGQQTSAASRDGGPRGDGARASADSGPASGPTPSADSTASWTAAAPAPDGPHAAGDPARYAR